MKNVICIPTYRRPQVINELLKRCFDSYVKHGFDVYIYDSSDDDYTKNIVEEFENKIEEGLYYVKLDSSIHSNIKVFMIYEEMSKKKQYEYIWVCSDALRWIDEALDIVCNELHSDYDVVVPNYRDVESLGRRDYDDILEFFRDCAWHMTLYGGAILKISKMLYEVDWNYLRGKYCVEPSISFSHVGLYFEQLIKIEGFKGLHLGMSKNLMVTSPYRTESGWRKNTFYIMCESWESVIVNLPEKYKKYKKYVILQHSKNSGILNKDGLIKLRKEKILRYSSVKKYIFSWRKYSSTPRLLLIFLIFLPHNWADFFSDKHKREVRIKNKLKKFAYKFEKIFIYGCGMYGGIYSDFLDDLHIRYEGFLVSEGYLFDEVFRNHEVIEVNEELKDNEKIGVILALNEDNRKEVIDKVFNGDTSRVFFCNNDFV